MGKDIYDALPESNREIWTVEDSEHCEIWLDYNQEYRDKIEGFLTKYE
jgi:outer membrane protease